MPALGAVPESCRNLPIPELFNAAAWVIRNTHVERVRLTGGEPLLRAGLEELVRQLTSLPSVREVSLTTNGSLLSKMAKPLRSAGLARVNISLDSLDPARFSEVTRGGRLEQTLSGIEAAREAGLLPIKLNTVLRRSTWRQEVPALLDYAAQQGDQLRFIELMRTGTERAWCDSELVGVDEVLDWITERATVERGHSTARPAKQTRVLWGGKWLSVGWIAPRTHPFCTTCERMRMDARGRVRRCLMDPATLDVPGLLRGHTNEGAIDALRGYLARKTAPLEMDCDHAMSHIGG